MERAMWKRCGQTLDADSGLQLTDSTESLVFFPKNENQLGSEFSSRAFK
jgi:hypothetical protein